MVNFPSKGTSLKNCRTIESQVKPLNNIANLTGKSTPAGYRAFGFEDYIACRITSETALGPKTCVLMSRRESNTINNYTAGFIGMGDSQRGNDLDNRYQPSSPQILVLFTVLTYWPPQKRCHLLICSLFYHEPITVSSLNQLVCRDLPIVRNTHFYRVYEGSVYRVIPSALHLGLGLA